MRRAQITLRRMMITVVPAVACYRSFSRSGNARPATRISPMITSEHSGRRRGHASMRHIALHD